VVVEVGLGQRTLAALGLLVVVGQERRFRSVVEAAELREVLGVMELLEVPVVPVVVEQDLRRLKLMELGVEGLERLSLVQLEVEGQQRLR
jgi:hypothetical protein